MSEQRFITVREAAEEVRVSIMTIHRLIDAGAIRSIRVGRSIRIDRASWEAYLAGREVSA